MESVKEMMGYSWKRRFSRISKKQEGDKPIIYNRSCLGPPYSRPDPEAKKRE